jgi:hypothetical protein
MKFILSVVVMLFSVSAWSFSMKLEGHCAGRLDDGTDIAFQYYSNFNGCSKTARAALSYDQGREGMLTGIRSFTDKNDTYSFGKIQLILANSTGNTTGIYRYTDERGTHRRVTLSCDVRDYEYADCN